VEFDRGLRLFSFAALLCHENRNIQFDGNCGSHVHYGVIFTFSTAAMWPRKGQECPNFPLKVYKRCFILQLGLAFKSCLVLKTVIAR